MKKIAKNLMKIGSISILGIASFGALATTLVSCVDNKNNSPIPTPPLPPLPPYDPAIKKSSLLFDQTNNLINKFTPYVQPTQSFINKQPMVDASGNSILVSYDYLKSLPEYKQKIENINLDKNIFKNYFVGLANNYVESTIKELNIPKSDVFANVNLDQNTKTCAIALQFSNTSNKSIKTKSVTLNSKEYIAKLIKFDFSHISFKLNEFNNLVVDGITINGKTDINGSIKDWDEAANLFNANNKQDLLNVSALNSSNLESNSIVIDKWKRNHFNNQAASEKILTDINTEITNKTNLVKVILDNVQPIANLIANNVTIKNFLLGIGQNLGNILNQFNQTKDFSQLVSDMLSDNGTSDVIASDLDDLISQKKLPPIASSLGQMLISQMGSQQIFVDWLCNLDYSEIHNLVSIFSNALPDNLKDIVLLIDKYFDLVSKLGTQGSVANVKILDTLASDSIKEQIPSLLGMVKTILPLPQQKSIIDIILKYWNDVQVNWTTTNIQNLFNELFNPYLNNQTTTTTPLNQVFNDENNISITPEQGTITYQDATKTYTINKNVKILFKNQITFKLNAIKALTNNIKISDILETLHVPISSFLKKLIDSVGTLGNLLPPTFNVIPNDYINILFKDENAIIRPNINGYQLICKQYINFDLKNTMTRFKDDTINQLSFFVKMAAQLALPPYIKAIENYYFGYQFAINSPFQVDNKEIGVNIPNIYDGKNEFSVNEEQLQTLKTTTIPEYIKNQINIIKDKKQLMIEVDQNLKRLIANSLNINDQKMIDELHMQLCLTPSFSTDVSVDKAPNISNAWIVIDFDQPYLNLTNNNQKYWTKNFILNDINLSNENTPTKSIQ